MRAPQGWGPTYDSSQDRREMKLAFLGLSLSSSWGNGHATVYRGLLKALHRAGHQVTFVEKDVPWYRNNRDMPCPDFARLLYYEEPGQLRGLLADVLPSVDVAILGSYFPDGILAAGEMAGQPGLLRLYYDIDTPITLSQFAAEGAAPYLRADQLPSFHAILSFTGGPALVELRERWGARAAHAFYCGLDPDTHRRVASEDGYRCRLGYMATYSTDRHQAWESLFLRPALACDDLAFVLAGPQYPDTPLPANIRHYQHLPPSEHSAFYSSSVLTLNITRAAMVRYGYSPSVRLFEAAGCGACVVSDPWDGLGEMFEEGREILVARDTGEMERILRTLDPAQALEIGSRAREKALKEHSYGVRAAQLMGIIAGL